LRIAEAVRALPVDSVLLDGEAVRRLPAGWTQRHYGAPDQPRCGSGVPRYDILQFQGDCRRLPLEIPRALPESLVSGIEGISFSQVIEGDGAVVLAHACKIGLEEIVSKRQGGVYSSGRCRNWLKVKNPAFERQ
jgi:bifunctional non-homologous end joining protein LigD